MENFGSSREKKNRVSPTEPSRLCAVVLCGGLGTRLRETVKDVPKPMAPVGGRPFLDIILDYAASFGIKNYVLAAGYKADAIKNYYLKNSRGLRIIFSPEATPLGTGGALKNAETSVGTDPFFVLNGDSICKVDLDAMLRFHIAKKSSATIALAAPSPENDYGSVVADESGRIISFREKTTPAAGSFINAGVYIFAKKIFALLPTAAPSSLERDIFPAMKNIFGYKTAAEVVDIGTTARYSYAQEKLAARPPSPRRDKGS